MVLDISDKERMKRFDDKLNLQDKKAYELREQYNRGVISEENYIEQLEEIDEEIHRLIYEKYNY